MFKGIILRLELLIAALCFVFSGKCDLFVDLGAVI